MLRGGGAARTGLTLIVLCMCQIAYAAVVGPAMAGGHNFFEQRTLRSPSTGFAAVALGEYAGRDVRAGGACCLANGSCQVLSEYDCDVQGGTYQGDDTDCDPSPCVHALALTPDATCYTTNGSAVTVDIVFTQTGVDEILGGQFFLQYDPAKLDFVSADVGEAPFTNQVYVSVNETTGTIDYAVGVPLGSGPGYSGTGPLTMATITFQAIGQGCDAAGLVTFRDTGQPYETRLTRRVGPTDSEPFVPEGLNDLGAVTLDWTAPTITCPAAINQAADAGVCYATIVDLGTPTTGDNCGVASVANDKPADDRYPVGVTTITWTVTDACGQTVTCEQTVTVTDEEAPVISGCPGDITLNADAGLCGAVVWWTPPTADDACGMGTFVSDHDPGDTFPAGQTTTVTYTATDLGGNVSTCTFSVTVSDLSELVVTVQLSPTIVPGPITRCITFELWACPGGPDQVVSSELSFSNGLAGDAVVLVPCGAYTCITARDALHTLRRTATLGTSGTQYTASFTGDPASGGDWLVGGNLNGDSWVDILDFGVFTSQWVVNYGSGSTSCSTSFPHADIDGSGLVWTDDFTFIQVNFLEGDDVDCCGVPGLRDGEGGAGPRTEIAVADLAALGLEELAAADLNGDGWLDEADIVAFLMGARP